MAKKQKPQSSKSSKGFGAKNFEPELQKAIALGRREQWAEVRRILEPLSRDYPDNKDVLVLLVNCCYELHDMQTYERASERLVALDPSNSDAVFALGGAYLTNRHPLLALQTLKPAIERWTTHAQVEKFKAIVADLEANASEMLEETGLKGEEGFEIAVLHERAQVAMETGDHVKAKQLEEQVLQLKPDFVSASNNLSLIEFLQGDIERAIAVSEAVLQAQPDNIHALSNLTRYYCLTGRIEQAQHCVDRLKASKAPAWDNWTKQMEAFSFLGEDQSVVESFEKAKEANDINVAPPMFFHLAAVAMARLGQTSEARKQWKKALELTPELELARSNLDNLNQMTGETAWAFPLSYWFTPPTLKALEKTLKAFVQDSGKSLQKTMQVFLEQHSEVKAMIPILFDRGDPVGRRFAFEITSKVATPELLEMLKAFALGQRGSDSLRHQAAIQVSEAGLLPSEHVQMWLQGQWREIALIAYEFFDEPLYQRSKEAQNLIRQALTKMRFYEKQEAEDAEKLLKKALDLYPDSPDILNNIGVAYEIQGRTQEAHAILHDLVERFSDYVPARAAIARLHLRKKEVEAASALLKPMVSRKRWHVDDFAAFSDVYLELLLAHKEVQAAKNWLDMWAGVTPDHPRVEAWFDILMPSPSLGSGFTPMNLLNR